MKNDVIKVLQDQKLKKAQQFNLLFDLYRKHPHANPMLVQSYNRSGYSDQNLKTLQYDIKKLLDIKPKDLKTLVVVEDEKQDEGKKEDQTVLTENQEDLINQLEAEVEAINLEEANYQKEILPLATRWADALALELKSRKKADLVALLAAAKEEIFKKKSLQNLEEEE